MKTYSKDDVTNVIPELRLDKVEIESVEQVVGKKSGNYWTRHITLLFENIQVGG